MSVEPGQNAEPPPLPAVLLEVWPVIVVGALAWLGAAAAAFLIPSLESWRPVTVAGLGVGLLGTGIFVWQLAAARRGARGAQAGLETYLDQK
jgi:protein-S-isoprenylcysteine O-methyltransferase Ste14